MNILFINLERSWRGGENQIYLLAKGLKQKGFVVSIAYPKQNAEAIRRFQDVAEVVPLYSARALDPRNILLLKNHCKNKSIRIIDANSSKAQGLALLLKKFYPSVKLVVHRRVASAIKKNIFTKNKYLSSQVDLYIAISNAIAKDLLNYGVNKDKVKLVTSAVSRPNDLISKKEAKEKISKTYAVDKNTVWIGTAAALTQEKGVEDLVQMAAKLKSLEIPFQCLIAGDGKLRDKIQGMIKNLGLTDCVHQLGFINDVPQFLRALDIMVLCSYSEGLGTVLLDAIYAEACILATNVGGIPEIVVDNKTGRLFKPGQVLDAAEKLLLLINSPEQRKKLNQQALQHVNLEFSLDMMVQKNFQNYLDLLSR